MGGGRGRETAPPPPLFRSPALAKKTKQEKREKETSTCQIAPGLS